jgi:hypothetical protein
MTRDRAIATIDGDKIRATSRAFVRRLPGPHAGDHRREKTSPILPRDCASSIAAPRRLPAESPAH